MWDTHILANANQHSLEHAPLKALTPPCSWQCAFVRSGTKLLRGRELDTGSEHSMSDARLCTPAATRIEHASRAT